MPSRQDPSQGRRFRRPAPYSSAAFVKADRLPRATSATGLSAAPRRTRPADATQPYMLTRAVKCADQQSARIMSSQPAHGDAASRHRADDPPTDRTMAYNEGQPTRPRVNDADKTMARDGELQAA